MSEQKTCPDCGEDMVMSPTARNWPAYHTQGGLECVKRQNSQLRAKNERLEDALLKTLDGEPILPQMDVWFVCETTGRIEGPLRVAPFCEWGEPDDVEEGETVSADGIPWAMAQGTGRSAEDCYSTLKLAEAAAAEQPEGDQP